VFPQSDAVFPQSDDYRFFKAIEEEFIRLRVTPLQLSPDDFQIAKAWRAAGTPLELVLAVLGEKIGAQREKGQEVKRRLSYYRQAVLGAWKKRQELLAPGLRPAAPAIDLAGELEGLAARLPAGMEELAAEIRRLAGEPAEVEAQLEGLEARAFEWLRASLSAAEADRLRQQIEGATAGLRHKLPADQLARVAESLERQLLRQHGLLPTFSIFAR